MVFEIISKGFLLSAGLIIAVGAQNIYLIKSGINKNHPFLIASICFVCDFILMSTGIFGIGSLFQQNYILTIIITFLGASFLLFYALTNIRETIQIYQNKENSTSFDMIEKKDSNINVILKTLSVTLLNPVVYLDTTIIIGSIGSTLDKTGKYSFLVGSVSAAFIWFFSIAYFSQLASKFFQNKKAYLILSIFTIVVLLTISITLFNHAIKLI